MSLFSTDVNNFHKKRKSFSFTACWILVFLVPLISCRPEKEVSRSEIVNSDYDASQSKRINLIHNHKRRHHHHSSIYSTPSEDHGKFEIVKKLREKSHKQLKHKNNTRHYSDSETKKTKILRYIEPEKKYFDYYPIEDVKLDYDPKEDDQIRVVLLSDDNDSSKTKRSKRDTGTQSKPSQLTKRNIDKHEQIENVIELERGNKNSKSGSNKRDIYPRSSQYYNYDPSDNRFVRPPNNFYLPAPEPFVPTSINRFGKYPIRGIYYNPLSPPGSFRPFIPSDVPGSVGNRFGEDNEDRVIWDVRYPNQPSKTSGNKISGNAQNGSGRRPSPPLIHSPSKPQSTTQRPSPAFNQRPVNRPNELEVNPSRPSTTASFSPPRPTRPTSTSTPQPQLSRCVWAIVSCCSRNNLSVRYTCFEQIGCHGAFWDLNPCADDVQDTAISAADKFFN